MALRQEELMGELNSLLVNTKKLSPSDASIDCVKRKYAKIDELWEEFERNNKELFPHKSDDIVYFKNNMYYHTKLVRDDLYQVLTRKHTTHLQRLGINTGTEQTQEQEDENSDAHHKKRALAIAKIHLDHLLTGIDQMDYATTSLGAKEMMAEEMRNQFTDWKAAFIAVQHLDLDHYDRESYDITYERYITLRAKLQDAIHATKNAKEGSTSTNIIKNSAELPKVKIPEFNGDISKWRVFYELFEQIIHQSTTLTNAAKMHFLKTYIKGDAARLINHLATTAENYESAYGILISRYDNTRILLGNSLDVLLELPQLKSESCKELKAMHDKVFECLKAIENLGIPIESWDAIISHIVVKKLDNETRKSYECQLKQPKEPQKVDELLAFMEARFMALETYAKDCRAPAETRTGTQEYKTKGRAYQPDCGYCGEKHITSKCDKLQKLGEQDRFNAAKEKALCIICLRNNHKTNDCKSNYRCEKCQKRHHTLLHFDTNKNEKGARASTSAASSNVAKQNLQSMSANNSVGVLLATAVINVNSVHGIPISMRALIDQGSQSAFITENAAQILNLPRKRISATIVGIGQHVKHANHSIRIGIRPRTASGFGMSTDAVILDKLSSNATGALQRNWSEIEKIQLADPAFYENNNIDIHLGAAEYAKIIKEGLIKNNDGSLIAQNTELGWIISGNIVEANESRKIHIQAMISNTEVDNMLRRFWEINEVSNKSQLKPEELECEKIFMETHRREASGRYMVKLPLRDDKIDIGHTRGMAIATFLQLEKKFARNYEYFQQYQQFIDEYRSLGHMIETNEQADVVNYLPHHAVFKDSSTTKIRVVFDASRKSTNGKSLNDNLMIGPTMQNDMSTTMMRWRKHRIAFTADIEKMYRQILVDREHTKLQRIIWRDSPREKLREYELLTVTYGTACAPYLAVRTLQQLAHDEQHNSPEACRIILNDFYVDDLASGADNVEEARRLQHEIKETLMRGGFNLRKWASNSAEILGAIPECDQEIKLQHDIGINTSATIKTLGIKWCPATDMFGFRIQLPEGETNTKRELLSQIASLFDPLGWLSPVIIGAKILIQKTWSAGISWDDNLPQDIRQKWMTIKNELPLMESIEIPRWIKTCKETTNQLHGFCDASEHAYAAVVYMKTIDIHGNISVTLMAAKTKVAPLNQQKLTIPRLELCGANLLAKLSQQIIDSMHMPIHGIFLWCDSKVVLAWLKGNPKRWKTFVANRAIEINGLFRADVWNYVRSGENPADCASRGIFPRELINHDLWWKGPEWLYETELPQGEIDGVDESIAMEEEKIFANNTITSIRTFELPTAKSYFKLQRIIARCLRFKKQRQSGQITTDELERAETAIIFAMQAEHFSEEIGALQSQKELKRSSSIRKLIPFIDANGLLRVGGRLTNSDLNFDAKHQLLIPHKHHVTDMIIKEIHVRALHGGPILTESLIRQKYWIIHGYRRIKAILHDCSICRRYSRTGSQQLMGNLPSHRVIGTRAFLNCGVDYAGPIAVRSWKGRGYTAVKGYISVFICLATKAIHLECVTDLTAEAFIAAFKRFMARRGMVANMYSDNGTNFVAANRLLQFEFKTAEMEYNKTIYSEMSKIGIKWHFIPPAAPNFGGLWEAGVRSVKTHMKKVIGESTLTYEELSTLLCQIEATLNSRPLCPLSTDVNDNTALTPGHFLIGTPLLAAPEVDFMDIKSNRLTRWQLVQKMHQSFWRRWNIEYLNRLQERPKWLKKIKEPNVNDLVLLKEDNLPPARWATGRITKKHVGQDGLTRVVEVKINDKIYKRPLSKICMLPGDNEDTDGDVNDTTNQTIGSNVCFENKKRKKPKIALSTMVLLMTLLFCMTNTTATSGNVKIAPFAFRPGIYFENRGTAYLSNTKWNIFAYYNMSHYLEELQGMGRSIKTIGDACNDLTATRQECLDIVNQMKEHFAEITEKNMLITNHNGRRNRRATLNFVGNILGDVFGVLGSKFEDQYTKNIGAINENEEHILQLMRNHTSIAETTLNICKKDEMAIIAQNERIDNMLKDIQQTSDEQQQINKITNAAFRILMAISKYEATQNNILAVLLDAHKGRVTMNILTPDLLRRQLQGIHSAIDSSILVPGEDAHNELKSLYSIMSIEAATTHGQLIFKITLPLILNEQFQLFKLVAVPTRHNGEFIWFEPSTPYLMTTVRRNYCYAITESEVEKCDDFGKESIICERRNQIHGARTAQLGCEIQLLNHENELQGNCKFKITNIEDTWIPLAETNKWIYVIYNSQQMDVICNNQVERQSISGEGIIHIQPHCIIHHASTEIAAHDNFGSAIYGSILPELNLTEEIDGYRRAHNTEHIVFRRENISTLDDMIRATKEQEKHLPKTISIHDYHHYGLGYTMVLGLITATICIFRYRRHNLRDMEPQTESNRAMELTPVPSPARTEPSEEFQSTPAPNFARENV